MAKWILVPDSFKGTMRAQEVCEILERQLRIHVPDAQILSVPVADGGEGSVDAFLAAVGGQRIVLPCTGPDGRQITGFYGRLSDGVTAVVEMAAAAGLPLMGDHLDALGATTYGVGELIAHAIENGATRLILGLGGSATNDGGCGCAAALGARFTDTSGRDYIPTGGTLDTLAHIDLSRCQERMRGVDVVVMCDIDNPLCGPMGASMVFGPQKGADESAIERLDQNLRHLAEVIRCDIGLEVDQLPGAGAAGGMGAGAVAFLGGKLKMGIDTVLDTVGFDSMLSGAAAVITGEGRMDGQSLQGKVISGVATRAKRMEIPVVVIAGDIGPGAERAYALGVTAMFSTNRRAVPWEVARETAREDLEAAAENLARLYAVLGRMPTREEVRR